MASSKLKEEARGKHLKKGTGGSKMGRGASRGGDNRTRGLFYSLGLNVGRRRGGVKQKVLSGEGKWPMAEGSGDIECANEMFFTPFTIWEPREKRVSGKPRKGRKGSTRKKETKVETRMLGR